jgi:rhodanese-related sulfurtransferase
MEHNIQPTEIVSQRSGTTATIIDVRTPAEFLENHLDGARNIPLHQLDPQLIREHYGDTPLYLICLKGSRGKQACERLRAAGLANVFNVEGGMEACLAAGVPMVRGQPTMSLERQVRIVAGSLVVAGALFTWLVHPVFILLSAIVGIGLVFAGVTDTCGMGMLLARMPWNEVS